jgi:hypothetical protein
MILAAASSWGPDVEGRFESDTSIPEDAVLFIFFQTPPGTPMHQQLLG